MTDFNQDDVEILNEELAFDGFFKVKRYRLRHKRFDGSWSSEMTRELFVRGPVAVVLPYDPDLDQVVLTEEFRLGAIEHENPWLLQIVAGIQEPNETSEELAIREAKEEAGLDILALKKIYEYWVSPGACNEYLSLYCAKVDASKAGGIHGLDSEHEDIRVQPVPAQTAFDYVANGKINNAATIIALQWLQLNHGKVFD